MYQFSARSGRNYFPRSGLRRSVALLRAATILGAIPPPIIVGNALELVTS